MCSRLLFSQSFLSWLEGFLFMQLYPSAAFARRTMSLAILSLLVQDVHTGRHISMCSTNNCSILWFITSTDQTVLVFRLSMKPVWIWKRGKQGEVFFSLYFPCIQYSYCSQRFERACMNMAAPRHGFVCILSILILPVHQCCEYTAWLYLHFTDLYCSHKSVLLTCLHTV